MNDSGFGSGSLDDHDIAAWSSSLDQLNQRTRELKTGADAFAGAMTRAFSASLTSGKQFDDILKSMALRLSDLAVRMAFKPLEKSLSSGIQSLLGGLFTSGSGSGGGGGPVAAAMGAIKPFAAGGVIGTPSYFPLSSGGVGLAGEAGPEAILPLARGRDGRLGVAASGSATQVTVQIATPDADSFRRSEVYLSGQIARAVARGQRGL